MGIFLAVFLGLGVWGYYDAAIKYPARGLRHAQWAQWQYLGAAIKSGYSASASVPDPVAEFARLSEPVQAADALLQAQRVPGQVDVDQHVAEL